MSDTLLKWVDEQLNLISTSIKFNLKNNEAKEEVKCDECPANKQKSARGRKLSPRSKLCGYLQGQSGYDWLRNRLNVDQIPYNEPVDKNVGRKMEIDAKIKAIVNQLSEGAVISTINAWECN
jgi:hypothetical protein